MSYKLPWTPKFSQHSRDITETDELYGGADPRGLESQDYGDIRSSQDLILAVARPHGKRLGQILAASLLIQASSVGSLVLAAQTVNEHPWLHLAGTMGLYLALRLMHTLLTNATTLVGHRMAAEMTGSMVMRLGHHIAYLAPRMQQKFSSGNLKTMAMTDVQTIGELVHMAAGRGVGFLIAPLVAPWVLYYVIGWPGLWAFFSMLLMIPFSVMGSHRMMRYFDAELRADDACTTVAGEWLKHQKTTRMMEAGPLFVSRIARLKRQAFVQARRGMYWAAFVFGTATRWWVVPPVAMLLAAKVLGLNLGAEDVVGSIWYLSLLTGQLTAIPDLFIRGGKAIAALKRLVTLLQEPQLDATLVEGGSSQTLSPFHELRLENVSVVNQGREILSQISLKLDLSKRTALVGQLGAGKSTLLALMSGQLFASEGKVLLENPEGTFAIQDRAVYHCWRQQQVLVGQEAYIEASDIKSNVCFDRPSPVHDDHVDVLQSLYDAAMEQDLANFRQGIHEPLGETGINLSGGQRQRLSLARALYSQRDFLFLDDPLSAVDEAVADQLWATLVGRRGGFVIATHRMQYIEACEQVIVLEGGRITAIAHPHDLIKEEHALFRQLQERRLLGALR